MDVPMEPEDNEDTNVSKETLDAFWNRQIQIRGLKELVGYIGGFDKWSILNEDCRQEVTKYLDYASLCKLERCSKQDYQTVKDTPIGVEKLEILANSMDMCKCFSVVVVVGFASESQKDLSLEFSRSGNDTLIEWREPYLSENPFEDYGISSKDSTKVCNNCQCCAIWSAEKKGSLQLILKSTNFYEEAIKFFEKWMKKCCYKVKNLSVFLGKYPFETSEITMLPNCRSASIGTNNMDIIRWWMKRLPENLKDLTIKNLCLTESEFSIPSEVLQIQQVKHAKSLCLMGFSNFTNEDLVNCQLTNFSFCSTKVNADGINQFVKKLISGQGMNDFKEASIEFPGYADYPRMLQGLHPQDWAELQVTHPAFYNSAVRTLMNAQEDNPGQPFHCYHILNLTNPNQSVTLFSGDGTVRIYANLPHRYR